MARRAPKRSAPLSTRYRIRVAKRGTLPYTASQSQKRAAIRRSHEFARLLGPGARAEVRTKEGALIYQARFAIIAGHPRFVVEEL